MQRPQREITLDDILITEELSWRSRSVFEGESPRSPNLLSENQALHTLARQLVNQPEIMLQSLVDIALELCSAGTAGVSLLEVLPSGEEVFGWNVLAGTLKQYVGNIAPRNFSPCGTCLDRGTPQLYSYPGRYFTYLQEPEAQIIECLVLPLTADNHALGTIWIVSHDEQRHFDSEDVRVMTSLADFTAAALLLNQRQTRELLAANAALEAEIVERKRSQEALRESEAYFKSLVNLVPDMLWRNDVTGNTSWFNQRWLDYTGQTMEEAQGYGWLEVIHPDDRAQSLANFQNAVDEGRPVGQEHRIRGTDGNYRWFLIQASPVYDAQGRIIQWFGAATDIHEQRTAFETLRELEERLRLAADAANFGTYEYLPQTDQINWSIALKAIHGLPEDAEITFARLPEFIHPADREQTLGKFQQFLSPDAPGAYEHEFRIVRTDGAVRWVLDKGRVFFTGEGEHRRADRAIGVTLDITDRKLSEAALRESEERLRVMIEHLPGGAAFVVDRNLRYLLAEGEALYAAGFKREDLVGKTIFEAMPPELTAKYEELYRMALLGESFAHEHNAHNRSYISRGTPLRSPNGEVYAVLAVSYDITDRKQAEASVAADLQDTQLLRELSARLVTEGDIQTLYQEIISTAIALMRADAGSVQILDEATQDLVLLATQGSTSKMIEHFHRVNASSNTSCGMALTTGDRAFIDFDVPQSEDPDGSCRMHLEAGYLCAQSTPLITRWGKPIGMVSTHWRKHHRPSDRELRFLDLLARQAADLIEQRQAQQVIQESEALLQKAFSIETVGVLFFSLDGRMTGANETFLQMSGYSRDELFNTVHWDVLTPPEFIDVTARAAEELAVHGETAPYEKQMIRKDGSRWWGLFAPTRLKGSGSESECVEFIIDITDRKRREQHQSMLSEISQELVGLENIAETMNRLGEKIGRYFGVRQCVFTEITDDFETAIAPYGWNAEGSPSLKGTYRMRDFLTDEQIVANKAGRTSIVHDTQTDPRVSAESYGALGIQSFVIVPLVRDNLWQFLLSIIDNKPRQWREDEVDLMQEITNRIWTRLERVCAEEAVRESEIQRMREQAAREEERQRAESLAELDRAKTLFFSNVSHEFRTPLTLSLTPLQDALSDHVNPLSPPHRERLELAHRNAIRLLKLVNTLLDFSRIEADRMEAVYEATDLALLTTELASVFRSAIERAGLRLIVDCPPLPEPVYVDRQMWEKIVLNLLSNAFKFTFEGEIAVRLHLADDHHVTLQVQDTGTGIPSEELPHLFERFYQVRGAQARTHEGSGIGLALVHELIRLHGGTVDVSSTVGQGTCFTITIPLGTAHLPNDRISATRTLVSTALGAAPYVEEAERWLPEEGNRERLTGNREELSTPSDSDPPQPTPDASSREIRPTRWLPFLRGENLLKVPLFKGDLGGSPGLETVPTPSPARILLVDDNADMQDYLTRILSEHVQVEAVADGAAALAAATERVPDLVLSDVMMPGLDGFELLKALRADARTREVPIILLSARTGEESVVEGLQAGADDYLIKPFSATELVTRVLAHLQMAHLRLEALRQERTTSRRKDEMLSTVSHELNTPLVAILGWTRLLRTNPSNQSMLMKSLETIERNATLQAKLISDLLDISRITAGKLHLNLQPVELQSVISMAIACGRATLNATVHQTQQTKDIELSSLLEPLPIIIQGDPDRLQQIVLNLLTNAIKFTPKGGRIEVRLNVKETHAQILVSDTGCGISAEFLPYVFDSFRQAESSKSQSTKGLGLGLAIARHLVELHGGTIIAESLGVGQGATFTVTLPLIAVSF
jgi:PAS domain S-box-containing protein